MSKRLTILTILLLCVIRMTYAAEPATEHTWKLADGESRPAATLADAAWLAGSWNGTAFGQQFEEVWSKSSAGSMVGFFKLFDDDGVAFYEIMTITVEDGSLSLKVKHFNADFTAWEDKEDFVNFRLVKLEQDALHFRGLSFYKRSDDSLDGYIVMHSGDTVTEHHLNYSRDPVQN